MGTRSIPELVTRGFAWGGMAALLSTGALLRYSALAPRGLVTPRSYNDALAAHGFVLLAAAPLLLFTFVPWQPTRVWVRPAVAGVLAFLAFVAVVALHLGSQIDGEWEPFGVYFDRRIPPATAYRIFAAGIAGLSSLVVLGVVVVRSRGAARVFLGFAALTQGATWLGLVVGSPPLMGVAFHALFVAIFAAPLFEKRDHSAYVALAAVALGARVMITFFGRRLARRLRFARHDRARSAPPPASPNFVLTLHAGDAGAGGLRRGSRVGNR